MSVSQDEYQKALKALQEVLALPKTDVTRDAAIQRFEFTVELAWKTCKKLMGTASTAPKEVIREMAQNGFITDVTFWLVAIDKRNLSSHTYNSTLADEVFDFAIRFAAEAQKLADQMRTK